MAGNRGVVARQHERLERGPEHGSGGEVVRRAS